MSKNKLEIQKASDIPKEVLKAIEKTGHKFSTGQLYVNSSGDVYRILRFEYNAKASEHYREKVFYQFAKNEELTEWGKEREEYLSRFTQDFEENKDFPLPADWLQLKKKALAIFKGEDTDEDLVADEYKEIGSSNEYSLMGRTTKDGLVGIKNSLELKKSRAGIVKAFLQKEIDKKKAELQKMTEKLYGALAVFQKQINKLVRIITTIELYLGVGEEMHQILQGPVAAIEEPITFRQLILFIDEEVGTWENGGLDWRNIDQFDHWLVQDENYKKILPEPKGMVVMKPRRYDKDYGKDAGIWGAQMNSLNRNMTYFLIRNGENVYRIYTDKISVQERWLPLRKEMNEYQKKIDEILKNDLNGTEWQEREKERVEKDMYRYTNQTLLMQGLIDRTEIFHPLPLPEIKLLDLHNIDPDGKYVRFIYDEEMTLPSGRLPFRKWKAKHNSKITHGSRILIAPNNDLHGYSKKHYKDRFYRYYTDYSVPAMPPPNVYQVEIWPVEKIDDFTKEEIEELKANNLFIALHKEEGYKIERSRLVGEDSRGFPKYEYYKVTVWDVRYIQQQLTILYNPKDRVDYGSGGWGDYDPHERKNRLRFRIEPEDEFVFNYDLITLDDLEFYIHSRVDRKNYLTMMPILKTLRAKRREEMKDENAFGRFVFGRNIEKFQEEFGYKDAGRILNKRIHESIAWWKLKNDWKRPIEQDNTLALRMIEKRIKSTNYDSLKKLKATSEEE